MGSILKKILLVEDEEDIRTIALISLQDIGGFEVHSCSNGEEAIAAVETFTPDLILMDVMMPGMDGIMTLKELRKRNNAKDIPIIFMTARVQPSEIQAYHDVGGLDVITKPFDPVALPELIKNIWLRL